MNSRAAMADKPKQRTLIALVRNESGVLTRVATAFRRRGLNLASLAVGVCEKEGCSRITLVVDGESPSLALAKHHLARLIDVIEVEDITAEPAITSELALIKVAVTPDNAEAVNGVAAEFQARTVDAGAQAVTFEAVGAPAQLNSMIAQLQKYGVLEISRTGQICALKNS